MAGMSAILENTYESCHCEEVRRTDVAISRYSLYHNSTEDEWKHVSENAAPFCVRIWLINWDSFF